MYLTIGQPLKHKDNIYKILEELGSGGYGTTYLVHDQNFNRQAVIKHIEPHTTELNVIKHSKDIFDKEVLNLAKLGTHNKIPELYDHFILENNFFIVQEFIEGNDLSKEIQPDHHWTEKQVITFLIEVLEILEFVHKLGITHQDIKPSNLMRRKSDQKIVLIDFGAVKQLSVLFEYNQGIIQPMFPIGTLGYISPEQKNGSRRLCSDLYSLGIVAIQAITGLDAESISNLVNTSSLNSLLKGYEISKDLIKILSKMVAFHFNNRYQYASVVLEDMKQLYSKQTLSGRTKKILLAVGLPLSIIFLALMGFIVYNHFKYDPLGKGELLSVGEDRILPNNPWRKGLGIKAIENKDYKQAIEELKKSFKEESKDPETLIYLNNALLEEYNLDYYTLAVTIPISTNYKNSDLPQSILRGVAQAQTEVNLGLFNNYNTELKDILGDSFSAEKAINNRGLKIIIANEGNEENQAQKVAKSLIRQPILGVIGSWTSDMTMETVDIYEKSKLVSISPGATTTYLTNHKKEYFFRTINDYAKSFQKIAEYLIKNRKDKVIFFYTPSSDFSSSAWEIFEREFKAQGGMIIHKNANQSREYDLSSPDFSPKNSLEKIRSEPEYEEEKTAIFLVPDAEVTKATENSLKLIKALPGNNKMSVVVGLWTSYKDEVLNMNNPSVLSKIILTSFIYPFDPNSNNLNFRNNAQQLWQQENRPITTTITPRTASAYDATRAFIEALDQQSQPRRFPFFDLPQKATRQGIQKTLADPNFQAQGSTATIEFNTPKNGDRKNPPISIIHPVKCGNFYEFVPIEVNDPKAIGLHCPEKTPNPQP